MQDASGSGQGKSGLPASTQVAPAQQRTPPEQEVPGAAQVGASQKQVAPGTQSIRPPSWSVVKHRSPEQHSLPPKVQACAAPEHVAAGVHTPPVQVSPAAWLQQSESSAQVWPVCAQLVPGDVQVPLVAPAGTSQASPAQQSASTVQVPAEPTHGAMQRCASGSHEPVQH